MERMDRAIGQLETPTSAAELAVILSFDRPRPNSKNRRGLTRWTGPPGMVSVPTDTLTQAAKLSISLAADDQGSSCAGDRAKVTSTQADVILTALYLEAEQEGLPHEPPYDVDHGLQRFSAWLDDQIEPPAGGTAIVPAEPLGEKRPSSPSATRSRLPLAHQPKQRAVASLTPSALLPTRAAQLKITAEPAKVKITARRLVTAEGTVPPGEARHLIAAFGILGSVVAGIAGAVLTLRINPGLTGLAVAELVLALAGAVLIAVYGRRRARQKSARE